MARRVGRLTDALTRPDCLETLRRRRRGMPDQSGLSRGSSESCDVIAAVVGVVEAACRWRPEAATCAGTASFIDMCCMSIGVYENFGRTGKLVAGSRNVCVGWSMQSPDSTSELLRDFQSPSICGSAARPRPRAWNSIGQSPGSDRVR
jgi:hypothetical protein